MSIQLWTKHYRRVIGAALLIGGAVLSCAVTVAYAQTETQAQAQAQARPDVWVDELILDVVKKPYRLSEAMIVLQEDNRFYVPLLEMSDLLDFAVESEQARGYASGWAVSEDNSFSIDVPRGEAIIRGQVRALSPEDVMTADEYDAAAHDIFISTSLAAEIWPVTFNVDFSSLRLEIESEVPLPFEARKEREQKRAAAEARRRIQPTRNPDLPLIANPYRMFSLPAVDLETQYSWDQSRGSISGQHSVTGVMDLLGFSTNFAANTSYIDKKFERPENIRVTGNRKAFGEDDIILGFKEMQVGDTRLAPRTLVGNSISGRGAIFSTREIERQQDFDQITVEGQAQPGWETELYRNNELLDFGEVDSLGEYRFENVQLMVGNNTIRVVLYGPQGQVEERSENYLISGGMVRPGEFGYEIGGVDAGQDFFPVDPDPHSGPDGIASSAYGAYGVGTGLTVFAGASRLPEDGAQRPVKNYGSIGAMFGALGGLAQVELYKDLGGGMALDTRFVGQFLGVRVNAQHALYQDFESPEAGFGAGAKRMETDVSLNKSINTGMGALGLQLDVNHQELINGASLSTINTRQSMGQGGIRLTHQTTTNLRDGEHTASSGILSATTRVRRVNLRGTVNYGIYPDVDLTSVQLDGRFTENDGLTAGAGVTHDFVNSLTGISGLVGYDFGKVLASVDVDWLQERGVQMVLRASTSLAPFAEDGGYMMSSDKLTAARPVRARLFLDNDMNNIFNDGDTPLEDARIQVGLRSSDAVTNADGIVTALQSGGMGGISSVQVDRGSLIDPYHVPGIEGYNAIPREGTIVDVDLPVVETGAIDGTVTRSDGEPVAGMKLELVDNNNAVAMTTETAYDGFYTFDYVRIGTYTVRADPSYGVNVPPISVSVASDELFAYGQDLDLLERAAEADVAEPDGVAHTPSVPNIQTSQPAPSSSSGDAFKAVVKKVRIGEHPDKLRLVLDLSATATYSVTPDGDGMGLTVNLPATAWDALRSWRSDTTPVMQSYSVEALPEGGTVWRIEGRGKIAAVLHGVLPPADGKGYRLFIDLQAAP